MSTAGDAYPAPSRKRPRSPSPSTYADGDVGSDAPADDGRPRHAWHDGATPPPPALRSDAATSGGNSGVNPYEEPAAPQVGSLHAAHLPATAAGSAALPATVVSGPVPISTTTVDAAAAAAADAGPGRPHAAPGGPGGAGLAGNTYAPGPVPRVAAEAPERAPASARAASVHPPPPAGAPAAPAAAAVPHAVVDGGGSARILVELQGQCEFLQGWFTTCVRGDGVGVWEQRPTTRMRGGVSGRRRHPFPPSTPPSPPRPLQVRE